MMLPAKCFLLAFAFGATAAATIPPPPPTALRPAEVISIRAKGETGIHYHVYAPATYTQYDRDAKPLPLVIAFSAGGKGQHILSKLEKGMDAAGCIVVGVDALRNNMKDSLLELKMEDEVLDSILDKIPHDPKRVYLAGFSGGAMRAYGLTVRRKEPFAGVLALGGWLGGKDYQEEPYPSRLAVAMVTGDADKGANKWVDIDTATLNKRGCRVEHFTFLGGHKIGPPHVIESAMKWLLEESAKSAD